MWGGQSTSDRSDSFTVSSSITNISKVLGSTSHGLSFFSLFFIWLCQVLAAACEIFIAAHRSFSCSMWDLVPDTAPCIGNVEYQPLDHRGIPLHSTSNVPALFQILNVCHSFNDYNKQLCKVSIIVILILQIGRVSTEKLSNSPTITQWISGQAGLNQTLQKFYQTIFSSLEYFYWWK